LASSKLAIGKHLIDHKEKGALAWIWDRSANTVPSPGFKTVAQIEEICKTMEFGPLTLDQMVEIDSILGR